MSAWAPVAGLLLGAIATIVAARLNATPASTVAATGSRTEDRADWESILTQQRTMLDRASAQADRDRARIDLLEREVAECERGRDTDRATFAREIAELRTEMRTRMGDDQ